MQKNSCCHEYRLFIYACNAYTQLFAECCHFHSYDLVCSLFLSSSSRVARLSRFCCLLYVYYYWLVAANNTPNKTSIRGFYDPELNKQTIFSCALLHFFWSIDKARIAVCNDRAFIGTHIYFERLKLCHTLFKP